MEQEQSPPQSPREAEKLRLMGLLRSPEGRFLLEVLRRNTIELSVLSAYGPMWPASMGQGLETKDVTLLREGQNSVVRWLESIANQGLEKK